MRDRPRPASLTAAANESNASRKWILESQSVSSASKMRFKDSVAEEYIYIESTGPHGGGQLARRMRRENHLIKCETRRRFHTSVGRGDPCTHYCEKKDAGLRLCQEV